MRKLILLLHVFLVMNIVDVTSAVLPSPPSDWKRLQNETSWLQYGFRLGFNIALELKYSETDKLDKSLSAEFGAYARFGKIVYGEIGFGYMFQKGTFESQLLSATERVETRYLQIPLKAVAFLPINKKIAFTPNVGLIYQPLIHVTKNGLDYNKSSIRNNSFAFVGGVGMKIHFITIDVAYRKNLTTFFKDRGSAKPSFFSIMIGFQF